MPTAFVLMPFTEEFNLVFEQLIEQPLAEEGFSIGRADLSGNQQQILKDIVVGIASADLVVVDVTGLNGNVMYELGLAHAMGKRTIMLTRDVSELPFDLRPYRAIQYSIVFSEAPKLATKLREIAVGINTETMQFSNPVLDFAPDSIGRRDQVSTQIVFSDREGPRISAERIDARVGEEEPGLLDFAVTVSETSDKVAEVAAEIGAATVEIGEKLQGHTVKLQEAVESLGDKAAPVVRGLLREAAVDFDAFAERLERQQPVLENGIRELADGADGIARLRPATTAEQRSELQKEGERMQAAEAAFAEARAGIVGFASTIDALPRMESRLNAASKRAYKAVSNIANALETGEAEFARVRGVFEERSAE